MKSQKLKREAKQILIAKRELQAFRNRPTIDPFEWNFFPVDYPVEDWELNHYLNYEYARSCEAIVGEVKEIRNRPTQKREAGTWPKPQKTSRFACYLAKCYPEFPSTPWLKIPSGQRNRRVRECAGEVDEPFEDDVIQAIEPFFLEHQIATGDYRLSPGNLADESLAIFKIDFQNGDKLIHKKFRQWLVQRRQALIERFPHLQMPRADSRKGQHNNRRTYKGFLAALAGLRLMKFFENDFLKCFDETSRVLVEPLYSDEKTNWDRANKRADELMRRFQIAWKQSYYPTFILRPGDYAESIHASTLGRSL